MAHEPTLTSELDDLLDLLRLEGYSIGFQEYIDVHDLLLTLDAQGRFPEALQDLGPLIGPLLCNTPEQQRDFQRRFEVWAAETAPKLEVAVVARETPEQLRVRRHLEEESRKAKRARGWGHRAQITVFLVTAAIILFTELSDTTGGGTGTLPDTSVATVDTLPTPADSTRAGTPSDSVVQPGLRWQDAAATAMARVDEAIQHLIRLRDVILGALGLALLLLVAQWAYGHWLASRFLSTRLTRDGPSGTRLMTQGGDLPPFDSKRLFRAAQNFRRHRRIGARYLDAEATVEKSVENAGWYSPVERHQLTVPEYLVLIDRSAARDHQAWLFNRLMRWLTRQGVFITQYSFDRDPRVCRPEEVGPGRRRRHQTIGELAAMYPNHRLAVFSAAANLVDPFSGLLHRWTDAFEAWPMRAFLTPDRPEHWGDRERQLSESGWLVYPGTEDGLHALVEHPDVPHPWEQPHGASWAPPLPSMIRDEPERWLDQTAPDQATIEELIDDLGVYLDEDGFTWLSASAVFPQLHWNLTVALGKGLRGGRGGPILDEDRLIALARLPWFRVGRMPLWLRDRLLHGLTAERRKEIKSVLDGVLEAKVVDPERAEILEIALQHRIPDLGRKILRRIQREEPPNSPMREQLFTSFMGSRLGYALTDTVRRMLRPSAMSLALARDERRLANTGRALLLMTWFGVLVAMIVQDGVSEILPLLLLLLFSMATGALAWTGMNRWALGLAGLNAALALSAVAVGAASDEGIVSAWLPTWVYGGWLALTTPAYPLAWRGWKPQPEPARESRAARALRRLGAAVIICFGATAALLTFAVVQASDLAIDVAGVAIIALTLASVLALPGLFAFGLSMLPLGTLARAPRARAAGVMVASLPLALISGVAGWGIWLAGTAGLAVDVYRRGPAPWTDTGWDTVGWGTQRKPWVAAVAFAIVGGFILVGVEYLAQIFPAFSLFQP